MDNSTKDRLLSILENDHPELCGILQEEATVMDDLISWLSNNPDEAMSVSEKLMSDEGFLTFLSDSKESKEHSFEVGKYNHLHEFDSDSIVNDDGQLNPIYEALILERLQFDGDIPELRFGNASSNVTPAVPVETTTGSMLSLGLQLDVASQEAKEELLLCEAKTLEKRKLLEDNPEDLALVRGYQDLPTVNPKKYTYGVIKPVKVQKPSGAALLSLSDDQKKAYTWKALSTTQGRNSACLYISEVIKKELGVSGVKIWERKISPSRSKSFEWTMTMHSEGSTQQNFPFLQVASKVLLSKIRTHLEGKKGRFFYFVKPINNISEREIGWEVLVKRS